MAQSPGDHNSRGPKFTMKLYKKSFPWGKLSELEHLRLGGLSLAVAFAFSGRYVFSDDGDSCGRQRGHDLTQLKLSKLFSRRFLFRLACSLAPAKKEEVPPRPRLYSALSPRDAWHVTPSHWFPRSDVDLREPGQGYLTQAPEPRANPQGKDNPLSRYREKDNLLSRYIDFYVIN